MNKLRYAIVGFGAVAKVHAFAAYQAALQFGNQVVPHLVGIMNRTPRESPLPHVKHYTDLAAMTAECRPDFLDLCMPHHLRKESFAFAAESALPV